MSSKVYLSFNGESIMSDMRGKVVLVTGATDGIGKSAAQSLAQRGAQVVIVGRNAAKTQAVVQEMRTAGGQVDGLVADLSSQAAIRRLADDFRHQYGRLDVLLNNVGASFQQRQLSVDGIEMTFALNHLGVFLLTDLLLDTLKASGPARIVNVSSGFYRFARMDFDNLQGERSYHGLRAYNLSKLENILFTLALARRLEGTRVTVNALNPGFTNTSMQRKGSGVQVKVLSTIASFMARPVEAGAATPVYLASSPEVKGVSGKYFADSKPVQLAPHATDVAAAERLWQISAAMVSREPAYA
jgi:NAD(P)-dependent dehydrogenase (short-subunit alcohol dehydrogenase family)